MLKRVAKTTLHMFGWHVEPTAPELDSYVLIGAPHTTNWDFPLTLLAVSSMGIRFNWGAKHTLFRWPLGTILKLIGGIPVDRSSGTAFLKRVIELFEQNDHLVLAIAPEGTRSKSQYWKKGFYRLAVKAGVPIVPGYIDYPNKVIGFGRTLHPSGDIDGDFHHLQAIYLDKVGKYPDNQGPVRI